MTDPSDPTLAARRALLPAFPALETPRLHLVELPHDPAWYLAHFSRPEIIRGTGYPAPDGLDAARDELERYVIGLFERRAGVRWGLVPIAEPGTLIGTAGIHRWRDDPEPTAEVGYDLVAAWWGQGLMTEALTAIVRFCFERLGLATLEGIVLDGNDRSCRTLERCGFSADAVLPLHGENERGELVDERRYLLRSVTWAR